MCTDLASKLDHLYIEFLQLVNAWYLLLKCYLIFHHLVFASPSKGPKPVLSSGGASVMSSAPLGPVPRSLMQDGSAWQSAIAPLRHWSNICTVVLASCSWPIPAVH